MHALPRSISPPKTTIVLCRKFIFGTLFALGCSATSLGAVPGHSIQVTMSPESFVLSAPKGSSATGPRFVEHLGHKAVDLPSGLLSVKGAKMRDGTIDVDVATKSNALFAGIAFRIESDANLEMVYQRPALTDTLEAMQYTPRLNGDAIWQLLNTSHEKATAHFPKDQWFHTGL